jgi:aspartate/methionine/tyrosine aminotransferase
VVVPTPSYEAYRTMPTRFGARVVPVPRAMPGFPYDPAAILAALTPRTRAVVLSSPCNPTGAVLSDEARAELLAAARERGIRLIVDLAYDGFRFDRAASGTGAAGAGRDPEAGAGTLVELHTASKNLGVCGWRIGWVIADPALVQALAGFQSAHLNPPNTVTQVALESMPDVPTAFFRAARDVVRARIDALHASLIAAGWPATSPAGGFYVFADARGPMRALGIADTRELCVRLATRVGVGLTPGSDFGQEGWVRASAVGLDDPARAAELAARLLRFATAR